MEFPIRIDKVLEFLPHRAPFVMIDRVLEIVPVGDLKDQDFSKKVGTKIRTVKAIAMNEPVFQGHFPGFAIFPGVMILEAMAQTACFAVYPYVQHDFENFKKGFQCILNGANDFRIRRPVVPGDLLQIDVEVTRVRGKLWFFNAVASVDGKPVADAEVMASLFLNNEMRVS
jgi:3-hydroxyacyl-[acyl-carrier-protein] dehydratase